MQAAHIGTDMTVFLSRIVARLRGAGDHSEPALFLRPPHAQLAARMAAVVLLVALSGALLLVTVATAPALFGYHTYNVDAGSLGSSLSTRSVAVTQPTDPARLAVGDVIAYAGAGRGELYRIVEISSADAERAFVLQTRDGAANMQPVTIQGRADRLVYSVPVAGALLAFAGHPIGQAVLVGAPFALLGAILFRNRWRSQERSAETPAAAAPTTPSANDTPERVRLHDMPLLKMVPLSTALDMAYRDVPPPAGDSIAPWPERIRLHEMPLLKMVPFETALSMAYREGEKAVAARAERSA